MILDFDMSGMSEFKGFKYGKVEKVLAEVHGNRTHPGRF